MNSTTSMIRLWQLISPALPIGAFSYSQSLEYAIDSGWLKTESDVQQWLTQQLHYSVARLDLPVMERVMLAWHDNNLEAVNSWNSQILAFRETAELYHEDCQVGYALCRLLTDLEIDSASLWLKQKVSYVTMYALICDRWKINIEEAMAGFVWAWCENLVAAAVKLLPMGQTSGQKMLLVLGDEIEKACEQAKQFDDEDLGSTLPGLAMASALHETQYSRLFRS